MAAAAVPVVALPLLSVSAEAEAAVAAAVAAAMSLGKDLLELTKLVLRADMAEKTQKAIIKPMAQKHTINAIVILNGIVSRDKAVLAAVAATEACPALSMKTISSAIML